MDVGLAQPSVVLTELRRRLIGRLDGLEPAITVTDVRLDSSDDYWPLSLTWIFNMAGGQWRWSTGWAPERDLLGRPADEVAEIVSGILAALLREWQAAFGRTPKPYDPVSLDAPLTGR